MNHELDIVQFIKKIRRLEETQKTIRSILGMPPEDDEKKKLKHQATSGSDYGFKRGKTIGGNVSGK